MSPTLRPAAIVLSSKAVTGLATVRALAAAGVDVHVILFDALDPLRFSRRARKIACYGRESDSAGLVQLVQASASRLGGRPVVMPTSDVHALMLAEHAEALLPFCRIWTTTRSELEQLVCKDRLYALASKSGLKIAPSIFGASAKEVASWSADIDGPYLLKPIYTGVESCALRAKNQIARDRSALLDYIARHGTADLVVQRLMSGGDGEIYDVYGLCDASGRVLTMASHRRIRQHCPNLGATCFGAIPSGLGRVDERLFEDSRRLLTATRFHGIFGIEWLRDRATNEFYVIDFNARPFVSIGHLHDCGLNLPALAYLELIGHDLADLPSLPALRPKLWVDLLSDIRTQLAGTSAQHRSLLSWARSIGRASSYAYWDWRDPGPGLKRAGEIAWSCVRYVRNRARAGFSASGSPPPHRTLTRGPVKESADSRSG